MPPVRSTTALRWRGHTLVSRIEPPILSRGRGQSTQHWARAKVELAARKCGGFTRTLLTSPKHTNGSRTDHTGHRSKAAVAKELCQWYSELPPWELVVFSNGSQGKDGTDYGYEVMPPGQERPLASGKGKLDDYSVVFDAEALGAWRGTERALQVASPGTNVTLCVGNTAAIWCLRSTASETSQ
jgi:hypothetical protein